MMGAASYVPGTLQFIGSPELEVLRMRYWSFSLAMMAQLSVCAVASLGLAMNHAGRPVASARRPTCPVPKSAVRSASRRFSSMVVVPSLQAKRERRGGLASEGEGRPQRVGCGGLGGEYRLVM